MVRKKKTKTAAPASSSPAAGAGHSPAVIPSTGVVLDCDPDPLAHVFEELQDAATQRQKVVEDPYLTIARGEQKRWIEDLEHAQKLAALTAGGQKLATQTAGDGNVEPSVSAPKTPAITPKPEVWDKNWKDLAIKIESEWKSGKFPAKSMRAALFAASRLYVDLNGRHPNPNSMLSMLNRYNNTDLG